MLPSESFIPKKKNTSKKNPQTHTHKAEEMGERGPGIQFGVCFQVPPGGSSTQDLERLCTFNVAPLTRL